MMRLFNEIRNLSAALSLAATAGVGLGAAQAEPAEYAIDKTHFSIVFEASHIDFAPVVGMFLTADGWFTYDEETRELSAARAVIDANSVFSNHEPRDQHLRSKDFLMADAHPEIMFEMTSADVTEEGKGTVTGDLTMRGVTNPITLDVTLNKAGKHMFSGAYTIGVALRGVVKRSDWGMTYAISNGAVGDEVPIRIDFEAARVD